MYMYLFLYKGQGYDHSPSFLNNYVETITYITINNLVNCYTRNLSTTSNLNLRANSYNDSSLLL